MSNDPGLPPVTSSNEIFVVTSPYEVARWRPLVHWLMFIPHAVLLRPLGWLAVIAAVFNWIHVLVTGRINSGLYGMMVGYERYNSRATGFLLGFSEQYAPFEFDPSPTDKGSYSPIQLNLPAVPESTPKKALLNFLLAIPHYIVLFVLYLVASVVAVIGWFAVLFTGRWPQGLRDFLVKITRYYYRVWAYASMVHTDYPKFELN